jgi:uncharacterized protein
MLRTMELRSSATRISSLDVLRGLAILGILFANIATFSGAGLLPAQGDTSDPAIPWILSFVNGKWRSLLAILFGVGLYLQYQKLTQLDGQVGEDGQRKPPLWPSAYVRRSLFLMLIGALHLVFLWEGDILMIYGITAIFVALMVNLSDRAIKIWIDLFLLFSGVLSVGCLVAGYLIRLYDPAGLREFYNESEVSYHEVFVESSYLDQVIHRLEFLGIYLVISPFFGLLLIPLFLFGIWLARSGVLVKPSSQPTIRNRCLWIGLGLGLPLNMSAFLLVPYLDSYGIGGLAWEFLFAPILSVGILMAGAVWLENGGFLSVKAALANVGRMALSNYLLQSVLCTYVFYSWGLGLYGSVETPTKLSIVAGVLIVNLLFSAIWLRFFDIGPVEWMWRSLIAKRRLPWRTPPASEPEPIGFAI